MSSTANDHALIMEVTLVVGYGGTKCVQHTLQVMEMDVTTIVTDLISVSPNYENVAFIKSSTDDIDRTYASIKANGLQTAFTHIITGFIGNTECREKVVEIIKDIKTTDPRVIYLCDPAFRDNGVDYYSLTKDVKCVFRDVLMPLADVTTPNQFEAECLSGMKILTQDDAIKAIQIIHDIGPRTVVITSMKIGEETQGTLVAMASSFKYEQQEVYRIEFPCIDEYMIGTGDMFVGSFIGLLRKTDNMKVAFEKAISICQVVCQRTIIEAKEQAGPGNKPTPHQLDLRLPQCTDFLMNPQVKYSAIRIV